VKVFGINCPGCGVQRAFIYLLKAEYVLSFTTYPPLLLFLFLHVFLISHLVFKFNKGAVYLKNIFIVTALAVLTNFIYRLITHL
jgi:hypothetical protein